MSALDTMIAWALAQRGKPYVWGGTGPAGFDCSGLVQKAAAAAGIRLPRTSEEQRNAGVGVPLADIRRGDLVTFTYADGAKNPGPGNHVAIYLGGGQVVEAARPGVPIRVAPLDTRHIDRVRRLTGGSLMAGASPAGDVTAAGGGPGLQQAGYDAVLQLTPWGIPLNPLKLPGYVAGRLGGLAQDGLNSGLSALADTLGPLVMATVGVMAGLALAVLGVYSAAKPRAEAAKENAGSTPTPTPIPV